MSCTRKIWPFAVVGYKLRALFGSLLCGLVLGGLAAGAATSATTTTTLTVSSGGVVTTVSAGSVVTLKATVTAGSSAITTGRVNFCDAAAAHCSDIHLLGTAQLTSAGTAALKFVPGIGNHGYKAVFAGTSSSGTVVNASSISDPLSLEVTGTYPTTTTIAQSGNAGSYSLTATVVGIGGQVPPSGTVSFLDTSNANYALGTAPLGAGIAALNFADSSSVEVGSYPSAIAVGDFNGDGISDYAVATFFSNTLTVLLGKGDGTFTAGTTLAVGNEPNSIAMGDFNGDGVIDLALSSFTDHKITVLLGKGDGTFTATSSVGGDGPIVVADFNGDGIADLVAIASVTEQVAVLLGNGDGTFTPVATPLVGDTVSSMAVGDFNGDGIPDLATVTSLSTAVTILLGNGDGTFTVAPASPLAGPSPESIAVADFDGDGKADLAVANGGGNLLTVLLGNGNGTFTAAASPTVGLMPGVVSVGDFNGDGIPDLALPSGGFAVGRLVVLFGKGDGTFLPAASPVTGDLISSIAVGDFNGDGVTDLAVGKTFYMTVDIFLAQYSQTTTSTASGISPVGAGVHQVEASYLGDSNYVSSVSSTVGLTAQPVTTALTLNANPANSTAGQQVTLTATLSPLTTQGHSTDGGTVTYYNGSSSLGTGTLAGGVAILNVTSLPVGTDSLTAVFGGDANFTASTSPAFIVVVAPPVPAGINISATTGSLTISSPGGSAADAIQVSSAGGFSGTVNLSCKVTYAGSGTATDLPGCSLNPQQGQMSASSSLSAVLTVTTTAGSSAKLNGLWEHSGAALATLFFLGILPCRRRKGITLLVLLAIGTACTAIGCGGGGSGGGGKSNPGTTPGTYQVVVTASSSPLTASTTITLTLQ